MERMPDYPIEFDEDTSAADFERGRKMLLAEHKRCCDHWSEDRKAWSLHSEDFDSSHDVGKPWGGTSVEAGVTINAYGATTYWIFDNDSVTDSQYFGDEILYPETDDDDAWQAWLAKLHAQLGQGAEVAWNSDFLSCTCCGYHHHVEENCCAVEKAREKHDLVGGVLLDLGDDSYMVTDYDSAVEDRGKPAIDALHPHYDETK